MPSFPCRLPVQRGGGRRSGSLVLASQDCSTSEAFSPRTVLTDNICTCVQQILQYVTTKMPFLTTSTITYSCLALVAPQADSWWLGHVVPDDVVIADIGGQALDILLHGPESAHKNGIVKTFIPTSIPLHTPKKKTKKKKKKLKNTLNIPNMMPSFACRLPVQRGGGRRSGSLVLASQDCSELGHVVPSQDVVHIGGQALGHLTPRSSSVAHKILQYMSRQKCPF